MKIDLTPVLNKREEKIEIDHSFDISDVGGAEMLPFGMSLTAPVRVKGTVSDKNNCLFLNTVVEADYKTSCDRCLDDINGTCSFNYDRMISVKAPSVIDPFDETQDDIIYVSESGIDIDESVLEEIVLELPTYHLCSQDCKGLCPKCGKKLDSGECNCSEEKEIDPRLKKLQKLLDNFD